MDANDLDSRMMTEAIDTQGEGGLCMPQLGSSHLRSEMWQGRTPRLGSCLLQDEQTEAGGDARRRLGAFYHRLSHMRVVMLVVIAITGLIRPSITFAQPDSESNRQILAATENLLTHYLDLNQGDKAISAVGSPAEVALGSEYIKELVFNEEYLGTGIPSPDSNVIAWHGVWLATLNHAGHSIGTVRIASPTASRNHYSPTEIWDLGCSRNLQALWQPNDLVVNHLPENEMYILRGNQAIALCVWTQQALGISPVPLGTLHQYLASRSNAHLPPTEALGIFLTSMPPLPSARLTTEAVSSSTPTATATPMLGSSALSHRLDVGTWAEIGTIGLVGLIAFVLLFRPKFTR